MTLSISQVDITGVDETAGLQGGSSKQELALADVPLLISQVFSNALSADGVVLADAIAIAGGGGNDIALAGVSGTVLGLGFVDADGKALDGDSSGLFTTAGDEIFLWADPANDNIVLGRTGTGEVIFAIYLEETTSAGGALSGGRFWIALFEPINHQDGSSADDFVDLGNRLQVAATEKIEFTFDGAPSGNSLFLLFGDQSAAIVVTGVSPDDPRTGKQNDGDTVNSSQGGGPTTLGSNGQQLKSSQGLYFTFVEGANPDFTVPNLSSTEAKRESNIRFDDVLDTTGANFTISQVNPTGQTVTVRITAFTTDPEPGSIYVEGLGDADDVAVEITGLTVNGLAIDPSRITLDGATLVVTGLRNGDVIAYTTKTDHNRVLIENGEPAGSNISFDIGGFGIDSSASAVTPVGHLLRFFDDGPAVAGDGAVPTLVTDDSDTPGDSDEADFSGVFSVAFGADGPMDENDDGIADAGALSYALGISAAGANSGLTDTLSGDAIRLRLNGDVVEGFLTGSPGVLAFTISVSADGVVKQTQLRSVRHDDPTDPDEADSPAVMAGAGLVTLTATATDGDDGHGDSASATADITGAFTFRDDGPRVSAAGTVPTLVTDDSDLPAATASDDFSGLFSVVSGADGAGTLTYALGVSVTDADSGLTDASTGDAILLRLNGGVVEGVLAGSPTTVAFTISVNGSGLVTQTQLRAIAHDDPTDPDEAGSPAALASAGLVTLTASATDGDGDVARATANVGSAFTFRDDGPSISITGVAPTLVTGDSDLPVDTASAAFAGIFSVDFGADGAADTDDVVYALGIPAAGTDSGLDDALTGANILLRLNGGVVEGFLAGSPTVVAFTLSVNGSGTVTQTQLRAIRHDDASDPDEATSPAVMTGAGLVTLTATATDGDGDSKAASADVTAAFTFRDDGPAIRVDNLVGSGTPLAQPGLWSLDAGADGLASLGLTLDRYFVDGTLGNGLVTVGAPITVGDAVRFDLSITDDLDGDGAADDTLDFSLTFNADGTYVLELDEEFGSSITLSTKDGSLDAGGPDPVRTLTIQSTEIVFFGVQAMTPPADIRAAIGAGEADLTEAQIESGGFAFLGKANMNVSTSGIGIGNNNLDGSGKKISEGDESFVVNPEGLLSSAKVFIDNSVGGYSTPVEELYYTIFYLDGGISDPHKVVGDDLTPELGRQKSFVIEGENGRLIDAFQLTMGNGTIKVPVIEFTFATEEILESVYMDLTATVTDRDGDRASDSFSVDVQTDDDLNSPPDLVYGDADLRRSGTDGQADSFVFDLTGDDTLWQVTGFDSGVDRIVLLGTATFQLTTSATDKDTLTIGDRVIEIQNGAAEIVEEDILAIA